MEFVVFYNKQMDKAVVLEPTHDQRMAMIINDSCPTICELWEFERMKRAAHARVNTSENVDNQALKDLIDFATQAIDYKCTPKHYSIPYYLESAYYRLKQLSFCYLVMRTKKAVRLCMLPDDYYNELFYLLQRNDVKVHEWDAAICHLMDAEQCHEAIIDEPAYFDCVPESAETTAIGIDEEVSKDQASNVIITTDREPSSTLTAMPSVRWSQFVSNDVCDDYATITNRWYTLGSFEWKAEGIQPTGTMLFKIQNRNPILPFDIMYNSEVEPCDMPNLIPFRVHTYWRGDIEVKIQVNSNKFQIGQLLACFYYQASQNMNLDDKLNIFSLSQMDHVIIQASASNDGVLMIPYKNVFPMLATRAVPGMTTKNAILNLGELYIMVMNPLTMSDTGPKSCKCSVLTRFINSEFTGTAFGGFSVQPEAGLMQPILGGAMKLLDTLASDPNRDNPPLNKQPSTFVPTASHNWSAGTGMVEPLHQLRLDSRGQTHHPPGCDADNMMTVNAIASRFGLVKQIEWKEEAFHKRGDELWREWAHPGISVLMDSVNITPASTYVIPPVGIISNLFMQWRGSLEFKFQIVASQFHTGRLMVGYIPGYVPNISPDKVSIKQLKASPHAIFDLQEEREFVYEVPFISYRPWWPRKNSGNYEAANSDPPSSIYVLVYNELIPMESVPKKVFINIYMRAGKSFEVSIPVQPSISLSWHKQFVYPDADKTGAKSGYYPYYYGLWTGLQDSNAMVGRWGALTQEVAQMEELKKHLNDKQYMYYGMSPNVSKGDYPYVYLQEQPRPKVYPEYAIIKDSGDGFAIIVPCKDLASVKAVAYGVYVKKLTLSDSTLRKYMYDSTTYIEGAYSTGNPAWISYISEDVPPAYQLRYNIRRPRSVDDFEHVNPEGEETASSNLLSSNTTLALSNHGYYFYGENHGDLKDYCRRYQMYGQVQFTHLTSAQVNKCVLLFHALPQGLIPAIGTGGQPNELFNRCREGTIPIIASLFRYYRGGLRFKIVFPADMRANVWVQHRPDRKYKDEFDRNIRLCQAIDTAQGVFNHGYGYYVQVTSVNPVVEFEVPFYNNTCYNFLQQTKITDDGHAWAVSLGQITVGIEWMGDPAVHNGKWVSVYYSLADDISFSQWVGGSRYLMLDNNVTATFENGPEEDIIIYDRVTMLTNAEVQQEQVYSQGFSVMSPFSSIRAGVKDITHEVLDDTLTSVRDEITSVMDRVYSEIGSTVGAADKTSISAILGNLIHVAVNPTLSTIATSVVNIVVTLGILGVTVMASAVNIVKNLFSAVLGCTKTKQHQATSSMGTAEHENKGEDPNAAIAGWVSLLYNGIMSMFNVTFKKPKTWVQWQHVITKDFTDSTRGANQIFIFIRNTMDCIRRMMDYILGRSNRDYALIKVMETDPECLRDWCKEVLHLVDPTVRRERRGDSTYINRVFDAQSFGQIILTDIGAEFKTDKNSAALSKLYDKITILKDELLEQGEHPHVRKLPFTVYVHGDPGIGKSFVSTKTCVDLLTHIKYRTNKGLKCTLNPQSDYWDQCEHQPVLEIDDLWAVNTPAALEKQLLTLFQVCSPIVLSPPKAAVEEKKMRYNPEIFYINSNRAFPVYNDVDRLAIWRRRDVLVNMKLSETKVKGCPHCELNTPIDQVDPTWLSDFHHVNFYIADNVRDSSTTYAGPYKYKDYINILKARFADNRKREQINFSSRIKDQEMLSTLDHEDEGESILEKYASLQSRRVLEYSALKQKTLTNDINELISCINDKSEEVFGFIHKKKWDITGNIAKYKGQLFSYAKHEANGEGTSYQTDCEIISDPAHEASFYASNQMPELKELTSLVLNGVLAQSEVDDITDIMKRFHDDGETCNAWLEYHKTVIGRMYKHDEKQVKDLKTILNLTIKSAPRLTNKPFCNHFLQGVDETLISDTKILATLQDLDVDISEPCLHRCILKSPYLKHLWYKRWLYLNPTYRLMYNNNKLDRFPAYLRMAEVRDQIKPDNIVKHFYIWLKNKWQKSLKPIISNLVWWIQQAWPKICQMLLGVAMVSAIAAPVYACNRAMKLDEEALAADKIMAAAYANERGISQDVWGPLTNIKATPETYNAGHIQAKAPPAMSKPITVQAQSSQQTDATIQAVQRNTVYINVYYSGIGKMDRFRCVGIRGRQLLVLRHYLEIMESKRDIISQQTLVYDKDNDVRLNGTELHVDLLDLPRRCYKGDIEGQAFESNFVIVELSPNIPEFKSLEKFILPWAKWDAIGRSGVLIEGNKRTHELPVTWTTTVPMFINSQGPSSQVIMTRCFRYPTHGQGMCGSVLLSDNLEKPIIGMHVAGVGGPSGFGLAEPIFAEMFTGVPMDKIRPQIDIVEPKLNSVDLSNVDLGSMLYSIGTVDMKDSQHQSERTQIIPSLIHGVFDVRTEPNPLSKNDPRLPKSHKSPYEWGCHKHGLPNVQIPSKLVNKAYEYLREKIITQVQPLNIKCGIVSEQVAICGIPSMPEYNALNFTTSVGFPLSSLKPKLTKGKRWCFNMTEDAEGYHVQSLHPKLRSLIDVTQEMRRRGLKPMTVFSDCLKDTTLPVEKCSVQGKTRIFSISPLQYTIPFRRYMLDFMAAYRRTRLNINHGIGIDVNSNEWTDLAIRIQSKGKRLITGDYSNYGPALNPELAEAAIRIIYEWYEHHCPDETDEDRKIRAILLQELIGAYHLCGNYVYRVPCGIPSGSPITDILNSIVGNLYIYCCWQGVTNLSLNEYGRHCYEVVYGDDLILNVSDDIIGVFNTVTMSEWYNKYLIKFTDADKSDNIIPWRDLDTATFLKHHFKQHPFRPLTMTAALDKVSVEGCANWIRLTSGITPEEATKQNCVMSCNLAFGHGPDYFNQVRAKLERALRDKQLFQPLPTWEEIDNRNYDLNRINIPYDINEYYIVK